MKRQIVSEAIQQIDTKYIDEANAFGAEGLTEAAPRPDARRKPSRRLRWGTLAACLALAAVLGGSALAFTVEAREYRTAAAFFEENGLSMEGLSRAEVKEVYRDITTKRFTLRKTAEGAQVLLTEQIGEESRETALGELRGGQALLKLSGSGLSRAAEIPALERTIPFRVEYLTDEGLKMGKRFTGALLGLGAVGEGKALFQEYSEEMRNEG